MPSKCLMGFWEVFEWIMHPTPFQNSTLNSIFTKDTKPTLPGIWQKLTPEQDSLFLPTVEALWLLAQLNGRPHAKWLLVWFSRSRAVLLWSRQKICLELIKWTKKQLWNTLSSAIAMVNTLLFHADSMLVSCCCCYFIIVISIFQCTGQK